MNFELFSENNSQKHVLERGHLLRWIKHQQSTRTQPGSLKNSPEFSGIRQASTPPTNPRIPPKHHENFCFSHQTRPKSFQKLNGSNYNIKQSNPHKNWSKPSRTTNFPSKNRFTSFLNHNRRTIYQNDARNTYNLIISSQSTTN